MTYGSTVKVDLYNENHRTTKKFIRYFFVRLMYTDPDNVFKAPCVIRYLDFLSGKVTVQDDTSPQTVSTSCHQEIVQVTIITMEH